MVGVVADLDAINFEMDVGQLYREDVFTDRRIGTIRRLTPVRSDGSPDPGRPVLFAGQTQVLTAGGMLPVSFEMEAATLDEAVRKFGAAAKQALEETVRELQEIRRQAASQLVLPDTAEAAAILAPGSPGKLPRR
jgi:hypothetical protein